MRIAMPVRALPAHRPGGLEYHALDLAVALAADGRAVTLVTSRHPSGLATERLAEGVEVRYAPDGAPGDYSPAFFRFAARTVAELERSGAIALVHSQEFAGLFLRPRRVPHVVTVHGTMFSETELDRRYMAHLPPAGRIRAAWRFKHRLALHPFFVRMVGQADRIVVDSEYTRGELLRIRAALAPRIAVVPLGLDFSRCPAADGAARPAVPPLVVAWLGRIQKMRGMDVVLRAARRLKDLGAAVEFRLAGSGDYLAELSQAIESQGLAAHVKCPGRLDEQGVARLLAGAHVFLHPDLTQPAFGLAVVEAMRCGLPVIAARSGALPETVTDDVGWLYDPWDDAELARIVGWLAGNPAELDERRAAARARAAVYDARTMAARVAAIYSGLNSDTS